MAAVLVVAILLPILYTGYSSIQRADSELAAQNYADAAVHYQQAARLLPWRTGLWEKAGIAEYANKNYPAAITLLDRAPTLSEQGWVALGNSHSNTGETCPPRCALIRKV